ncbi:MAG: leucine dehydrogenase [Bacteroidetes bacterium]|nr:leucine dehydrogenase [Bacteroidota bacterium]
MDVFNSMSLRDHEQVVYLSDNRTGLRAIIAIHNTTLGPALGGTRMWAYEDEAAALKDVLRLSRGMTYKAAAAGLNLGGGKAVIIGNPKTDKNEALFRSFGRFIEGLAGRYITAEDVGTETRDMEWVRAETKYVTGISKQLGGSGDPSPVTALGVYMGIKATVKEMFGTDVLTGKTIAVQGAGHVGSYLVGHLRKEGCKVYITDIDDERVTRVVNDYGAIGVSPSELFDLDMDVYSPCALGATVNDETIPKMKAKIIAGAANNQLADEKKHGQMLLEKGILYAPDYVINAGGLINVANELEGYNQEKALTQARSIYDLMLKIYSIARENNIPTYEAANLFAEKRLELIGGIKSVYVSKSEFSGRLGEMSGRHR